MKGEWDGSVPSVTDIVKSTGEVDKPMRQKMKKDRQVWTPPTYGIIKVNVDGSFLAKIGK